MTAGADAFPDPTRPEARALIVGTGGFWACWGLALVGALADFQAFIWAGVAALAFLVWLYFGGVLRIDARASGQEGPQWPWFVGSGISWLRVVRPSYYARSARVLGWSAAFVLSTLAVLLIVDLVLFVLLFTTGPAGAGGR